MKGTKIRICVHRKFAEARGMSRAQFGQLKVSLTLLKSKTEKSSTGAPASTEIEIGVLGAEETGEKAK